eukprot:TRINITY_DN3655_c0_g1_i1.p1 TRINITY_DN3655_c0_g1~~TRINITY_DN3655_c0_g1_i1.p1  ORF type:complete len:192 (+),score=34.79 TRINITY_DN3655_c0_g1_i1:81-656(+)
MNLWIHIKKLPTSIGEAQLVSHFSRFGPVAGAMIPPKKITEMAPYGFVKAGDLATYNKILSEKDHSNLGFEVVLEKSKYNPEDEILLKGSVLSSKSIGQKIKWTFTSFTDGVPIVYRASAPEKIDDSGFSGFSKDPVLQKEFKSIQDKKIEAAEAARILRKSARDSATSYKFNDAQYNYSYNFYAHKTPPS